MEIAWIITYNFAFGSGIAALLTLWKKYKLKSILHPFNYFLLTWLISILSFGLAISVGMDWLLIEDERLLSQLFFMVAFTNCIILIAIILSKPVIVYKHFKWEISERFLITVGFILLLIGLYSITTSGFDVVGNRLAGIEEGRRAAAAGERGGFLSALIGLFLFLKMPILIYNGFQFYEMYISRTLRPKFYIFFVLIGSSFEVIAGGGRSGIVTALTYFVIGILINHVKYNTKTSDKYFVKKLVLFLIIPILLLSAYINFISSEREKEIGYENVTKTYLSQSSVGEKFYGIMEYSLFHILGYQLRMNDTATDELEFGQYTFQFITKFNLPIASQLLKEEINLANFFNLKYVDNHIANINAQGLYAATITATVYFILYDDFGFYGSLVIIFLFTFFTQRVYIGFIKGKINGFYSIIIILFLFDLWKYTWFSHHLNGTIFNPYLYSALILYIIKKN